MPQSPTAAAFGSKKIDLKQEILNIPVDQQITGAAKRLGANADQTQKDINQYASLIRSELPGVKAMGDRFSGQLSGVTDKILSSASNKSGEETYKSLGDYQIGAMKDFIDGSLSTVPLAWKAATAARGYGGAGGPQWGTYARKQLSDSAYGRTLPYISQIMAGLGRDASALTNADTQRTLSAIPLITEAMGLPFQYTDLLLRPGQARSASQLSDIGALRGLTDTSKANRMAWLQKRENAADRFGAGAEAVFNNAAEIGQASQNMMGSL